MNNIKIKKENKSIKTANKKENIKYFIKDTTIKNIQRNKRNEDNENNSSYAVNKTVNKEKQTALKAIDYSKNRFKNRRILKQLNNKKIKEKMLIDDVEENNYIKNRKLNAINRINKKDTVKIKENNSEIFNSNNLNYGQRMKSLFLTKHKNKLKEAKGSISSIKNLSRGSLRFFKGTASTIKKTVTGINNLITAGTGLILLLVITLFIGVFSALSEDSTINNASMYVSEEVLAYTPTIEKYAKDYGIEDYVPLIQAVMMQESGGRGNDPMQSSECGFNEKYPRVPGGITDPDYSIQVGIQNLADCLNKAGVKDVSDIEKISLALQGYNYGNGYISWALEHFGGYTKANAKVFSDEMKAKLQTDVYGDPDYVEHVLRYYHPGQGGIVLAAKSQIGVTGGKKYWEWYGFKQKVNWCAIFVSWCASESGDLGTNIPKFAAVMDGMNWFKNHDKWKGKNYLPSPGDIVFFDWQNNNLPDHVGIIENIDDNYIYVIEGNSSDEVKRNQYLKNYEHIFGYGIRIYEK